MRNMMNKITLEIRPTIKQGVCWKKLRDNETTFVLFGGGAGGGKSWLGCEWLLMNCLAYPGTKWFIGRNELIRIMSSTYITFLKVCSWHKIPPKTWVLNSNYSYLQFFNGSRIDLIDCSYRPRDPLYERYGSIEYTGGWLEEAGEIKEKAFDVLKSRIGRQFNDKFGLLPKMFLTCNPKKNWTYVQFYRPWRDKELPEDACFIQSLYTDNPYTADTYGEMLSKIKDPIMRSRLKNGEWEYDDDDSALMKYERILEMFTRDYEFQPEEESYISVDVARFGRDKSVFILWQGFYIKNIFFYDKTDTVFMEDKIKSLCNKHKIPIENVVVDSDGVGGGVVDHLPGVYSFVNGSRPIEEFDDNVKYRVQETGKFSYQNLRAQCYDRLADYVNEGIIACSSEINPEIRNWIIQEFECIKKKNVDKNENKFQVVGKDEIKETIGRSPDFSDAIMMRMAFGLGNQRETLLDNSQGGSIEW